MEQLNRLRQFRQAIYQYGLTRRRDAQQELLDALLLFPNPRSFPYLSLAPVFRRQWHSTYAALEDGQQDRQWLTEYLTKMVPQDFAHRGIEVFALDETPWPRRDAPTLPDRRYVHSAKLEIGGTGVVVGHSYSLLAWSAEASTSWVLPLSCERISSDTDAIEVAVKQLETLTAQRSEAFDVIVADSHYGNERFLGAVKHLGCGLLVRLRSNRVLCRRPGPYSGRGRRRVHGQRFAFRDPETWGAPAQRLRFDHARFGRVELELWEELHGRRAAATEFSVVRCQIHLDRPKPPKAMWLAWLGPRWPVDELWRYYQRRVLLEEAIRFRKQDLLWTRPQVSSIEASLVWTELVSLAQWTLFLAREMVTDRPLPWQRRQVRLTPGRVRQSLGSVFVHLGTPARGVKRRGQAPGWPVGRRRSPRERHAVQKKTSVAIKKAFEPA